MSTWSSLGDYRGNDILYRTRNDRNLNKIEESLNVLGTVYVF